MNPKVKGYIEKNHIKNSDYEESYILRRRYFLNIFSTLNLELTEKLVYNSIKKKKIKKYNRDIRRNNE